MVVSLSCKIPLEFIEKNFCHLLFHFLVSEKLDFTLVPYFPLRLWSLYPFYSHFLFFLFFYILIIFFFRKTKKITSTSIQWEKLINDFGMHYLITKCSENIFLDFRIFKKTLKIMKMTQMHQKYIFWIFKIIFHLFLDFWKIYWKKRSKLGYDNFHE